MPEEHAIERLRVPKLAELVAARVTEWITSRELGPGSRLPSEKELMERFGVARTVIREAIAKLRALGAVTVFQGRGAFVAEIPVESLLSRIRKLNTSDEEMLPHIWELREILESHVAELAAVRRTASDVDKLEDAVEAMERAIKRGSIAVEEDERFHMLLTHAAHNPVLEQVMNEISGLIQTARIRALQTADRPRTSLIEHAAVLRAVKAGKPKEALAIMQAHVAKGKILTTRRVGVRRRAGSSGSA